MNENKFFRVDELALILGALDLPSRSPVLVTGPPGIGKTILLLNLHARCSAQSRFVPVYCSCRSEETLACNLSRVEEGLGKRLALEGNDRFEPSVRRRIEGQLRSSIWYRTGVSSQAAPAVEDVRVLSLLERLIDTGPGLGYGIGAQEARALFFTTLVGATKRVGPEKIIVLMVDMSSTISSDFLELLISCGRELKERVRLVIAFERTNDHKAHPGLGVRLDPFSLAQIDALVSDQTGRANKDLASRLWERHCGHPFLTDRTLRLLDGPLRTCGVSDVLDSAKDVDTVNAMLYSHATDAVKRIMEVLAALYDGGDSKLVSQLAGIPPLEALRLSQKEDTIDIHLTSQLQTDVWLDLFHPTLKDQVARSLSPATANELRHSVGRHYLEAIEQTGTTISYGACLSIPSMLEAEPVEFVEAVVRTLPFAILVGNPQTTKKRVSQALEMNRIHESYHEAVLVNTLGILAWEEGHRNEAVSLCRRALTVAHSKPSPAVIQASILSTIASMLHFQDRLAEALQCEKDALTIVQKLYAEGGFEHTLSAHLSNIALLYQKLGDLPNSLKHYEEALEADRRTENYLGVASDLRRLGGVLEDMGRYDEAIKMHLEALKQDERQNNLQGIAWDAGNLGVTFYLKGDRGESLLWLKRATTLFSAIGAADEAKQTQRLIHELSDTSTT